MSVRILEHVRKANIKNISVYLQIVFFYLYININDLSYYYLKKKGIILKFFKIRDFFLETFYEISINSWKQIFYQKGKKFNFEVRADVRELPRKC